MSQKHVGPAYAAERCHDLLQALNKFKQLERDNENGAPLRGSVSMKVSLLESARSRGR